MLRSSVEPLNIDVGNESALQLDQTSKNLTNSAVGTFGDLPSSAVSQLSFALDVKKDWPLDSVLGRFYSLQQLKLTGEVELNLNRDLVETADESGPLDLSVKDKNVSPEIQVER